MTYNVQTQLEEFSLCIIGALNSGNRPTSLQRSYSQIGIGDYCAFASSAITHLINKGVIQQSEKKECSLFMINMFIRTIGHRVTPNEVNEIAGIFFTQVGTIESNFDGLLAVMSMARK